MEKKRDLYTYRIVQTFKKGRKTFLKGQMVYGSYPGTGSDFEFNDAYSEAVKGKLKYKIHFSYLQLVGN